MKLDTFVLCIIKMTKTNEIMSQIKTINCLISILGNWYVGCLYCFLHDLRTLHTHAIRAHMFSPIFEKDNLNCVYVLQITVIIIENKKTTTIFRFILKSR